MNISPPVTVVPPTPSPRRITANPTIAINTNVSSIAGGNTTSSTPVQGRGRPRPKSTSRTRARSSSLTSTVFGDASPTSFVSLDPWTFKEGKVPWDEDYEAKSSRSRGPAQQRSRARQPWDRLGLFGFLTLVNGLISAIVILSVLAYLWTTEGVSGSEDAPPLWRWVMLGQHITQAVTLLTVLLRIAITTSAAIITSLIAGIMLEKHGVPLSQVAEFSVLRSINDGPLRLAWLLLTSSRKSTLQTVLTVVLLATTVAVQFSSTILVSDLNFSTIVGESISEQLPVSMTKEVTDLNHQQNNWLDRPTAYVPFGEISSGSNSTPTAEGVSDTGVVRRVFLPVDMARRESLRRYRGQGIVFNSRYVCMRPAIDPTVSAVVNTAPISYLPLFLSVSGSIDYAATFAQAGLPLPENCPNGACFPSGFNCSLPQLKDGGASTRQGFTNSACLPDGKGASKTANNFTLSDEIVPRYAGVFLFFRNNGTMDLWKGPNDTSINGNFPLAAGPAPAAIGEWLSYSQTISSAFASSQFTTGTLRLDISLCFQQLAFDVSQVQLYSPRDLRQPTVSWDSSRKRWDTSDVRRMILGASDPDSSTDPSSPSSSSTTTTILLPSDRGIFTVESISDSRKNNMATHFSNRLINYNYNSPMINNVSLFLDPLAQGKALFLPHVEYQVLFSDILNSTNRPGVALQSTLTALSGSIINEAVPQFNSLSNATTTSSHSVLTPRRSRGLVAVASIVFLNVSCAAIVLVLFFLTTSYSTRGNYWQVLAQATSEHSAWLLEGASEMADWEVEGRTEDVDPNVVVARSARTGRVQVILAGAARQGY